MLIILFRVESIEMDLSTPRSESPSKKPHLSSNSISEEEETNTPVKQTSLGSLQCEGHCVCDAYVPRFPGKVVCM